MATAASDLPSANIQNMNISAYRVLYILLTLVQYRSLNMVELNRFLYENPLIQRAYNTETLTKYINTLREVGCDIPRSSSRTDYCYELRKHPFPIKLEPDEIQIAEKLLNVLSTASDELLYKDYRDFLEWLTWSVDTVKSKASPAVNPKIAVLFPELETQRKLLSTYRQYCQDAFTLQIQYQKENQTLTEVLLEPHSILERNKRIFLLGLNIESQEQASLDIGRIESIRQLPSKNKRSAPQTTVVFALFERLSRSYRVYPNEKVIYQNSQELQIKAKVNDPEELLNRLMKYGASCEVLSPGSLRLAMKERVESLLTSLIQSPD